MQHSCSLRSILGALPAVVAFLARRKALVAILAIVVADSACLSTGISTAHRAELRPAAPLPIELFRDRYLFCAGRVDGREVDMLLDCGAGITVLSESFAAELGLAGSRESTVQGSGGRQSVRWAEGVELEVGNLTLHGLRVAILDLRGVEEALGRDLPVILGREVFASCVVDIDPTRRTLSLLAPATFAYEGDGATLPLVAVNAGWITIASVNGGDPLSLDVDTGSGGNLTLFRDHARETGLLPDDLPPPVEFSVGVGGRSPVRRAVLDTFRIGPYVLEEMPIQIHAGEDGAFATSPADGNLGTGVLYRFRAIFDASRQKLHLEPGPAWSAPFDRNRSGLVAFVREGYLEVVLVVAGSRAERDGWRVGDCIVAVDGVPVDEDYWRILYGWTRRPAGTRVTLETGAGEERVLVLEEPPTGFR